ncbi:unnamed protein product [Prorocentrum cordatum]|uniref:Uncharacterized protein n=1 Tax=Prorocentrum cordatum TaxID=2364126 RepID=A0ABN9YKN9_9DINO|nr:unnamed protein product [Polarella glacialis]
MEHFESEDLEKELLKRMHDLDPEALLNSAQGALTDAQVREQLVGKLKDTILDFILRILPAVHIERLTGTDRGCDWEINDISFSDFSFQKENVYLSLGAPSQGEELLRLSAWDISAHFRGLKVLVKQTFFPYIQAEGFANAKAERMSVSLAFRRAARLLRLHLQGSHERGQASTATLSGTQQNSALRLVPVAPGTPPRLVMSSRSVELDSLEDRRDGAAGASRPKGGAAAEGVPSTSGCAADVRHRAPPADWPHGASRHDVQMAIRDILSSYALGSVVRSSVSHFIGVSIDQWSPRGVRILEGKNMPCIPEDQPLAWCARESIRSERDCWKEAMKIVRMLVPGETVAVDLNCPRQKRRLSGTLLLSHAKAALLPRRAADIKMKRVVKRVVPVGRVSSDGWMEAQWIALDESSFQLLSGRLSQSQCDKLAALQHKLVELQRKEERQVEAARGALQAVCETQAQMEENKAQLDKAKADAAKAQVGSPSSHVLAALHGTDANIQELLTTFAEGLAKSEGTEEGNPQLLEGDHVVIFVAINLAPHLGISAPHSGMRVRLRIGEFNMPKRVIGPCPAIDMSIPVPALPWEWHSIRVEQLVAEELAKIRSTVNDGDAHRHCSGKPWLDLAQQCMACALTVESLCAHRDIDIDFDGGERRRGWTVQTVEAPVVPATAISWQAEYHGFSAWAALYARVADWLHLREKLKDPAEIEHAWKMVGACLSTVWSVPRLLPREREERGLRIVSHIVTFKKAADQRANFWEALQGSQDFEGPEGWWGEFALEGSMGPLEGEVLNVLEFGREPL